MQNAIPTPGAISRFSVPRVCPACLSRALREPNCVPRVRPEFVPRVCPELLSWGSVPRVRPGTLQPAMVGRTWRVQMGHRAPISSECFPDMARCLLWRSEMIVTGANWRPFNSRNAVGIRNVSRIVSNFVKWLFYQILWNYFVKFCEMLSDGLVRGLIKFDKIDKIW